MTLLPLRPVVRRYAWGSTTVIPDLLGVAPDGSPQAELWFGAHPSAPSTVVCGDSEQRLDQLIAAEPRRILGDEVLAAFGPRLPFLLKVLAVDAPLSLQVHPTPAQAAAGFAADEALGLARDDPRRRFPDASHKPELVVAVTDFEALVGFRPPAEVLTLAGRLGSARLDEVLAPLWAQPSPAGLHLALRSVLSTLEGRREALVADVASAIDRQLSRDAAETGGLGSTAGPGAADLARVRALAARYPDDPGVVAALLLRPILLRPGEAIFVAAGVLHAYLRGTAVELQSSSDNVLRGGLTAKPVDVPALLRMVDVAAAADVTPQRLGPGLTRFAPPVSDFALWVHDVAAGSTEHLEPAAGPQVVLCVRGDAELAAGPSGGPSGGPAEWLPVRRGRSLFVPAGVGLRVSTASGSGARLLRATTNLPSAP